MIVPNQYFDITIAKSTRKYFRELGYSDVNVGDTITVPLEHLNKSSKEKIKLICDDCGDEYSVIYKGYNYGKESRKHDYCSKCILKNNIKNKYGVENVSQLDWVQDKGRETRFEKYGAWRSEESIQKCKNTKIYKYGDDYAKIAQKKAEKTCLEKYGVRSPMEYSVILEKSKQTLIEKYNVDNISKADVIKEKKKETFLRKYGVENPSQFPEFAEKVRKSYFENGNVKTSSQQLEIYNILKNIYTDFNIEINYPFKNFNFDISMLRDDIKIDIEYDGQHWHQDNKKDRRRDEVSKSYGWKVLRIKSGHKIPTIEQLEEAINRLINGHSYAEIKLDDWKEDEIA